ncbi:hypothetical protein N9W57_07960, partial [Pseudomonadales bacterium]|nr:hypothetical protein [Pseudomonadales bacterium]
GYTQQTTKSLYRSWMLLDKNKIDHLVSFEILDRCDTEEEMFEQEQFFINELDTLKNGFNTIPGGKLGKRFLNEVGVECTDPENKDDLAARFYKSPVGGKNPHYVSEHIREYKPNLFTYVKGHFRNLSKSAEKIINL